MYESNNKVVGFAGGTTLIEAGESTPQVRGFQDRLQIQQVAMQMMRRQLARAKYDAAQTFVGNERHWSNADYLGPHRANSLEVRRVLRARSRYEIIENNPFLKGTILTIANDFVGSGPKLEIIDPRINESRKKAIEESWDHWCRVRKIRRKLWRMRVAKIVDGESFAVAYRHSDGEHPVELDFRILEADQVSSYYTDQSKTMREIDGVRFDEHENPLFYHILYEHPGDGFLSPINVKPGGTWVDSRFIIHWFRQDRGWLRGIPELTPSIPLCALLRRYTLAIVRHAETAADITAVIETQQGANTNAWTDGSGGFLTDDPFDSFPINIGEIMNLPKGYTIKQLNAVPTGAQYDKFVGSVLKEIVRPIFVPYNIASGSSADSNMASGVLDQYLYVGGQKAERFDCDAEVLNRMFRLWWNEASLVPDLLRPKGRLEQNRSGRFYNDAQAFKSRPIEVRWRWDKVGIDHTDPQKVAAALDTLLKGKILTDRQVQEEWFNRDYEDWQKEVKAEEAFRLTLPSEKAEKITSKEKPAPAPAPGSKSSSGSRAKSKPSSKNTSAKKRPRSSSK